MDDGFTAPPAPDPLLVVLEWIRKDIEGLKGAGRTTYPFRGYMGYLYLPDLTVLIPALEADGYTVTVADPGLIISWENGSTAPSLS